MAKLEPFCSMILKNDLTELEVEATCSGGWQTRFLFSTGRKTLQERSERMLPGVVIGIILGTVYVLTLSLINFISLPALHLGLDWGRMLAALLEYDLALALVGAISGWFTGSSCRAIGGGIVTLIAISADQTG